jgi:uncharacterized protein (TIGR02996 family)
MARMDRDLEAAAARLGDGDFDGALAALLAAWERTRAPELIVLIDEVDARVTLPPLAAKSQRDALLAWVELARQRRASDVKRLLVGFAEAMASGHTRFTAPRVDELLVLAPDPRIARALVAALEEAQVTEGSGRKVWIRVVKGLTHHAAPELTGRLERATGRLGTETTLGTLTTDELIKGRLQLVLSAWRARVPDAVSVEEAAAIRAALDGAPAFDPARAPAKVTTTDEATLLARIYEQPDDDALRLVFADWLSERGDPRGELITLQCARAAGRSTPAQEKRERALLKAGRVKWLGAIAKDVAAGVEFERGFPSVCTTRFQKLYVAEASLRRPEWATLREIAGLPLLSDTMRSLEIARHVSESALRRLGELTRPLKVHTMHVYLEWYRKLSLDEPVIAALVESDKLPALVELRLHCPSWTDLSAKELRGVLARPVGQRLKRLYIVARSSDERLGPILDVCPDGLEELGWSHQQGVELIIRREGGAWKRAQLTVHRSTYGAMRADYIQGLIDEELAGISAGAFAELVVVLPKREDAIAKAAERVAKRTAKLVTVRFADA